MSVLAALVLTATPAAASLPATEEIVVLGERLKTWRGKFGTKKGVASCRTTKSTGDREIDAIGCAALVTCITPHIPQMQAIAELKLPKAERDRRLTATGQNIGPCIVEKREVGIAALADRRSGL